MNESEIKIIFSLKNEEDENIHFFNKLKKLLEYEDNTIKTLLLNKVRR